MEEGGLCLQHQRMVASPSSALSFFFLAAHFSFRRRTHTQHIRTMLFQPNKLKVQLKLAINRLKMLQAKKTSLCQHQRREIATLLDKGKEESARVRVEHVIREDLFIEAMEILELYCDLLLARFGLIEQYK